jgi:hypothetical protein
MGEEPNPVTVPVTSDTNAAMKNNKSYNMKI